MDCIYRCLVSVKAMIYGSGWMVSMFYRSMMAVYIPRVLRVRAVRLWCVKMGSVGGNKKERKKSLTRGHVKDIGSAGGIQSYYKET